MTGVESFSEKRDSSRVFTLLFRVQFRIIARKSSVGGFYVRVGGPERLCLCRRARTQKLYLFSVSYFNLGAWSFVWGD